MTKFERISENIDRLELPWRLFGLAAIPVSVYLIRREGGFTLVDSGPPETADLLVSAVSQATDGTGVQRVLITHAHSDHVGGLNSLQLAWNPEIVCHKDEAPFLGGYTEYRQLPARGAAFFIGRYFLPRSFLRVRASWTLEAGQAADGMAVIHLPGHTPGQVGYLHPSDQAMICGDAVMNFGGNLRPPVAFATPDPWLAHKAMRRLAQLDYEHLLPSHGPVILNHGRQAVLNLLRSKSHS